MIESMLHTLVGRSIAAVTYYEIDYGDGTPMWNQESESFDSLDFGLTLRLNDGSVVSVTWGHEFTQYNITLQRGDLERGDTVAWDATPRWNALVGEPIVEASLAWDECLPGERYREYPQSLVLRFQSVRSVVISAFESRGDDFKMGMMDHVTVFFDEDEARRFRVLGSR